MSDTSNTGNTATKVKRTNTPRSVDYTLEVMDSIPSTDNVRRSPLNDQIDKVRSMTEANPSIAGKAILIGRYEHNTAAGAAANVLRQRFGRSVAVEGFTFKAARLPIETDDEGNEQPQMTGLFVTYDPEKVVPGAKEKHDSDEEARRVRLAEAAAARKAEANGSTNGNADSNADSNAGKAEAAAGAAGAAAPATSNSAPANANSTPSGSTDRAATQPTSQPEGKAGSTAGGKTGSASDKDKASAAGEKR